jgi:hypothetical protein
MKKNTKCSIVGTLKVQFFISATDRDIARSLLRCLDA